MGDLYYVGDTVDLAFAINVFTSVVFGVDKPIKVAENLKAKITKINVSIFSEQGQIVHEDPVTVIDNVVKYQLNGDMTKHSGNYAAFFHITFGSDRTKTHKILFVVLPRNLDTKKKEVANTARLTPKSTDGQIIEAIGHDTRTARRLGNIQTVMDMAQTKVGRRLPK